MLACFIKYTEVIVSQLNNYKEAYEGVLKTLGLAYFPKFDQMNNHQSIFGSAS